MKNKEFIICATIYINDGKFHDQQPINIDQGFVVCGRRHHNCYQTIQSITGLGVNDSIGELIKSMSTEEIRKHQGFVTSLDRYVVRKEGWIIAKNNNQIQYGLDNSDNGEDSILISENLY